VQLLDADQDLREVELCPLFGELLLFQMKEDLTPGVVLEEKVEVAGGLKASEELCDEVALRELDQDLALAEQILELLVVVEVLFIDHL